MRYCLYGLLLVSILFANGLNAQRKVFDNADILTVLSELETASGIVFNYSPDLVKGYTFSGEIDLSKQKEATEKLFYRTPLQIDYSEKSAIIYLPEKTAYRVCGYLKDVSAKSSLPFANIFADDGVTGDQSNDEGFFDFTFLAHKNQEVTISYIGYVSQKIMVQEFSQGKCMEIFLELDEDMFESEIVVTDYILDGISEGSSYSEVSLDFDLLSNTHTNIEQDIMKTIQLIPGVSSVDESASNIQIRGGTADQNLIVWDGAALYDPGHLFGMISSVNPFIVDEVKVFKGVFSPAYESRVGGVVDMSLSDSVATEFHGGVGTTFTEAHAYVEVPIVENKLSIIASGRNTINQLFETSTLGNYSAKVFQDTKVEDIEREENEVDQVLKYYDWNGKLIFTPTEKIFFSGSYYKSSNEFNYRAVLFEDELESTDVVNFDSDALALRMSVQWLPKLASHFSFANSSYSNSYFFNIFDIEDDEQSFTNDVFNEIKDRTYSWTNTWAFSENFDFDFGYDYNEKDVRFNVQAVSDFELDYEDFNVLEDKFHSVHAAFQFSKQDFQINGGIRSIYSNLNAGWDFSPRVNMQYSWSKNLKLKLSAGILKQYIGQLKEFGDNDLGLNNQVWILTQNESESSQTANKIAGGFVFRKNGWLLDVEAYYTKTDGLNTLSPLFGTNAGIEDFASGSSEASGLDFLLKKKWGGFNSWVSYSLGEVDFLFPEVNANSFPASHQQRHNLSWVNSYKYKSWMFSLSYQYRSGLPFSEPTNIEFNAIEEFYEVNYDNLNQNNLKDYSRLDLGMRYESPIRSSKMKVEASFSIMNILNRENLFSRDYYLENIDEEDDEPELFFIDKFLLKRTPQLLIRLHW